VPKDSPCSGAITGQFCFDDSCELCGQSYLKYC
jgi:hypothetical protein